MPITANQIQIRLSGGIANNNPLLSLGGNKSANEAGQDLFDKVTQAESTSGRTEYRCVYVHNSHPSLTLQSTVAWLSANTPSDSTVVALGLGASGLNGAEPAVVNEDSMPAGIVFVPASSAGTGVSLGDIPPGQSRAIWVRRIVAQGAATAASDSAQIRIDGGYTE